MEPHSVETVRPVWDVYAADLVQRFAEHGASPTTVVVGILGYVVENENVGVDEHERAMAKAWLERLVDSEGNPLDDKGRNALEWASEENAINHHGSLSRITHEEDRVGFQIDVLRTVAPTRTREELHTMLEPHFATYLNHLLDALYEDAALSGASAT